MGSFKGRKRNQGSLRRRGLALEACQSLPEIESLESRTLLNATTTSTPPTWHPTSTNLADVQNGPMANAGQELIGIYQAFVQDNGNGAKVAQAFPLVNVQGNLVTVDVKGYGDFNTFVSSLTNVGMEVYATNPQLEIAEGLLPINDLPTVATSAQTVDIAPVYKPQLSFVGTANNEADATLQADVARQQFNVDGTGVGVGVLSDSVNQFQGGLSESVSTGNLPNNVQVVQDNNQPGATDEGRAMLENIHDIAPGASLAFATAAGGDVNFANDITKLATVANDKVIVDDVGYLDEPFFQDGIVSQAVTQVTQNYGVTYFSAAGNSANQGYESQFREIDGTAGQLPVGRYMNFDPGSGVTTELPITTGPAPRGGALVFQFDQPFYSTGAVVSQVNFYILNAKGAVVAVSNSNNVATQQPLQVVSTAGLAPNTTYFVAMQVVSGPDPGHVEFVATEQTLASVSQQFGSAGGTTYPTTFGHPTAVDAIGVGAVPWWGTNPTDNPAPPPVKSEPFSSFGPATIVFDASGNPLPQVQVRQKPDISAPDGGNTSFFAPGEVIDTSNPPNPGEPATPTNLSQANLPSFFGTSSAAPNAAAVAALMLQQSPTLTPTAIRSAMIASATPLNGTPQGTWDVQGGFGLINAVKALSNSNVLRVVTTTPSTGQTLAQPPSSIIVTFNKPVDITTLSAADIVFTIVPPGVTAAAFGTPIGIDDPRFPTQVAFPFSLNAPTGVVANGTYSFSVQGAIVAKDGTVLSAPSSTTFTLNDTIAPRVDNVSVNGRIITVQFSEPMRPSTINSGNIYLIRAGGPNNNFGQPGGANLSNDPRAKISYDPTTSTVTLDYSGLDQSELPTDNYALVIQSFNNDGAPQFNGVGVTDLVGNFLNGAFNGVFPSGTPGNTGNERFVDYLGVRTLSAPAVTSLQLAPSSDTGIPGDENTTLHQPVLIGQVAATFPGTVAGLTVVAEFDSLHGNNIDLGPGGGGRGYVGGFDVVTTTDANGAFTIQAPFLPEGYQLVRTLVVGQPDQPPLPGLSSYFDHAFRIDNTGPEILSASLAPGGAPLDTSGTNLSTLTALSLNVIDQSIPLTGPLATPPQILFPALDPSTADNLANYSLLNTDTNTDESSFIATANFVPTGPDFVSAPGRTDPTIPYAARVDLTFRPGIPGGHYVFVAHTAELNYSGLRDAAGNPLNNEQITAAPDFGVGFTIQPVAPFITNLAAMRGDGVTIGGPRSFFETPPAGGVNTRDNIAAPPTAFAIDFSTPLNPNVDYTNDVLLVGSGNPGGTPTGSFGTLGVAGLGATGTGFTVVPGTTVTLADQSTGAFVGQPGFFVGNRLVLHLATGTTLTPNLYRLYIPNSGATAIFDIYGNQLDGEFLGNQTATGGYEDLLPNGQYRQGLSGDGTPGGAFMTGFDVVPYGNVLYARPDYVEDPLNPATAPDGSIAKPYPTLAPEGNPSVAPANPNNDPNGGLNATSNFFNFNPLYDRNGNGHFDRSALYAAQELSIRGPVVVIALPGTPQRNPITQQVQQQPFVLEAGSQQNPLSQIVTGIDGSASVPFDTTLVFSAGSALKLQNASLYVQNQGSALQVLGGPNPNQQVNFTSYSDDSIGGDTNRDATNSTPHAGDWGGIVFRNFDNVDNGRNLQFPVDGGLHGPTGSKASSGADDTLSILNFANLKYSGGPVPQSSGVASDSIELFNSRPTITNSNITLSGLAQGTLVNAAAPVTLNTSAAIAGDLDSFREDDVARGPLIRRTNLAQNSVNGILLRPDESTGAVEETDAVLYPANPTTLGGAKNFTFADPLPYVLLSQMYIGQELLQNTGGQTSFVNARLYVQPGMMIKSQRGAGMAVVNNDASINIGNRTYINEFDANPEIAPISITNGQFDPNFKANPTTDARVLFTSIYDNAATTSYIDPTTQQSTIIVPAIDVTDSGGANQPTPGNVPVLARWGSVSIQSGAVAVINDAEFRYGGGLVNGPEETFPTQSVLAFITDTTPLRTPLNTNGAINPANPTGPRLDQLGTHAMITDNNFFDNLDAPMQIEPNGLMAGDPIRPLLSGQPFFRGNVMQRNDIDGLAVVTNRSFVVTPDFTQPLRPTENPLPPGSFNLSVNSVWSSTDLTYVLRGTIVLAGSYDLQGLGGNPFANNPTSAPLPDPTQFVAEPTPFITLTLQSALPGTVLANGEQIGRPGEPLIVKAMSDFAPAGAGSLGTFGSSGIAGSGGNVGAGFSVGVDDGVDPPGSPFLDPGINSQLRILGIGGDQTSGQQRVPVIITSLRDDSVGTTVRGVTMNKIYNRDPINPTRNLDTPTPGDGGYIYFGGNSLTDYNLFDPRGGNLIDNADIRYLTRIEIEGGGVVDTEGFGLTQGGFLQQKLGLTPLTQFNSAKAMTISNSNLSLFADAAVFAHQNALGALVRDVTSLAPTPVPPIIPIPVAVPLRTLERGEGVDLLMYGDTITNSPVGVQMNSDTALPGVDPSPNELTLMNNTFYNDTTALHTVAAGPAANDHVYWLALDNIFSNSTKIAIQGDGNQAFSQAQYNLYFANGNNLQVGGNFFGNYGAIVGDPQFRNPAAGNFQLGPNSAAIDAARSEIGPLPAGDAIYPAVNQQLDANGFPTPISIRTDPATLTPPATPGRSNPFGGNAIILDPRKLVELPGTPGRGFFDQWIPILTTNPNGVSGPASNAATYNYVPIQGVRDALGYLRVDDPNVSNIGFGRYPFYDIGAFEFRQLFPPQITAVTALQTDPTSPTGASNFNIYKVGGIAGGNQTPLNVQFQINHTLDPSSVTNQSVLLEESGGDGIFGNNNSPLDRFIDLTGHLDFNPSTNILTIHLADQGLILPSDVYRIVLQGSGSNVLRDPQGNALDGENTLNDNPNNPQLALPSGDGFPGGNFYLTFTINTESAVINPMSFVLSPTTDSNRRDNITDDNFPAFVGSITVATPAIDPIAGQTVVIDISTQGNGVFDRPNAGTAVTNAQGQFIVSVGVDAANTGLVTTTAPLPDSPYNVGVDGLIDSPANTALAQGVPDQDDFGYSVARVRVINSSGNSSSLTNPNAYTTFAVDTHGPVVTSFSPAPGTVLSPSANGTITFTFTVNKNLDPASVNANSILVKNAGPDGILGTADDVAVPINPGSIVITPLKNGPQGPEQVSFTVSGNLGTGLYAVTLKGTGASPIIDVSGNPLNGANGTNGQDFNSSNVVSNPTAANTIFVGGAAFVTNMAAAAGTRGNPYPTIAAGLAAAVEGDVVAVLPGVYTERIAMKSLVRLVSADPTSTDGNVIPGDALATIIRAPSLTAPVPPGTVVPAQNVTVSASFLFSIPGLSTEISGFTIASPLLGDPALGALDYSSIGLRITNSSILVDRDYFVDSGFGIAVETAGANAAVPEIINDGLIGNVAGILVNDTGGTTLNPSSIATINNDTFAFNNFGLLASVNPTSPIMAQVFNDIFWENHDQTTARVGAGIYAGFPNKLILGNNLFQGNGPSDTSPQYAGFNVGNGFNANLLGPTPDSQGNFTGDPAFVSPRDPRPGADGPASFFIDANFDLTLASAAIDAANNSLAPPTDFLNRARVTIPGRGFPGTGPADVGAFEFQGVGGLAAGGAFRVVTTSVAPVGAVHANGVLTATPPSAIVVRFSSAINPNSISPTDLALSGSGVNAANPVRATSLAWIDNHTVQFNLAGTYNNGGSVQVTIPNGSIRSSTNAPVIGFSDTFNLINPPSTGQQPTGSPPALPGPVILARSVSSKTPAPAIQPAVVVAPTSATPSYAAPVALPQAASTTHIKAHHPKPPKRPRRFHF